MAHIGGIDLCYEAFGSPADPDLLLVMGLGTQMIGWPDAFCEQLAGRGFHVIRYDNRDIGRSTHLRGHRPPTLRQLLVRDKSAAPYSLGDMAQDGIGLLEELGIREAHVVGASMGGMIAQLMAARHPARVRSLASIMSNTGHLWKGRPAWRIYPLLMRRPVTERDAAIESTLHTMRTIGSPGFPFEEESLRSIAHQSYERGHDPAGTARQLAAIVVAPDRTPELRTITAPTVVIHGTSDRLVTPSGGRATAEAIPGAALIEIEGMGHDLPRGAWDRIVDAVVANARREDASSRHAAAA